MEDKKNSRIGGTKVSEIANIFQGKVPSREDNVIIPLRSSAKSTTPLIDKQEESPAVTVMRTESQVARFNNARALFEKLGEENRTKERIIPLQSTKSASSILDLRSRSSSANSETRDTKSHHGSRSPSPKRKENIDKFSKSVPVLDNVKKSANGFSGSSAADNISKTNGNSEERTKPVVMKKPEKPERKFNSKELIEKQRNWTSHFNKTRTSRYNSDPNKSEIKVAVNNGNKEVTCDNKNPAARSSSFSTRVRSPTSPPSPPVRNESKRTNVIRRERPTSVIPTTQSTPLKRDNSSPSISPSKTSPTKDYVRKERATSLIITSSNERSQDKGSPTRKCVPRNLFKRDEEKKENQQKGASENRDILKPASQSSTSRSPLEDKDASRENLSATSGSLSSLSPPSSPNRLKSENEKQEQEDNEKYLGKSYLHFAHPEEK